MKLTSRIGYMNISATALGMVRKAIGSVMPTGLAPALAANYWGWLREPFAGAWQRNIQPEQPHNIVAFSAVYACVTLIANDISKLRPMLVTFDDNGLWKEDKNSRNPKSNPLDRPNRYQTREQFLQQWVSSKFLHGNAYILVERDNRNVVTDLYVLNPFYVMPLVGSDGSVWYRLSQNWLAGLPQEQIVPASEIIHDRCTALWHPLVGVSPIYACGASATQGIRIQANSAKFYENMSRPSGMLTAPGTISDDTAERLKKQMEDGFMHANIGRLFVAGDGIEYKPMTMTAQDSQLIEQLKWTVEDVCRAYKVPFYKVGGPLPASLQTVAAMNQDYYSQTLQSPIDSIEALLAQGLSLPVNSGIRFDLDGLLRMDPTARSETYKNMITSGILAPNEARRKENLPDVEGGDTPYLQQQNYSLAALAARDAAGPAPDPSKPPTPTATPALVPPTEPTEPTKPKPPGRTIDDVEYRREDAEELRQLLLESQ